jgi:hypothetical protein
MKYRKRAVLIDAIQYLGDPAPVFAWALDLIPYGAVMPLGEPYGNLVVDTPSGTLPVSPGDWITCDAKGEFGVCGQDIFAAEYEAVVQGEGIIPF